MERPSLARNALRSSNDPAAAHPTATIARSARRKRGRTSSFPMADSMPEVGSSSIRNSRYGNRRTQDFGCTASRGGPTPEQSEHHHQHHTTEVCARTRVLHPAVAVLGTPR